MGRVPGITKNMNVVYLQHLGCGRMAIRRLMYTSLIFIPYIHVSVCPSVFCLENLGLMGNMKVMHFILIVCRACCANNKRIRSIFSKSKNEAMFMKHSTQRTIKDYNIKIQYKLSLKSGFILSCYKKCANNKMEEIITSAV